MTPEFSRLVRLSEIGGVAKAEWIEASAAERAALVARFALASLDSLRGELSVRREAAGIRVKGRVIAEGAQLCVVSAEPVPMAIDEPVDLLFAAHATEPKPDEEIELGEGDLDVLPLEDGAVDLGEAAAQTFGLALDPYPRASDEVLATARQRLLSEEEAAARAAAEKTSNNPFSVLKGSGSD
ncbi:YceD family protein [Sphingoaurantiacus capsulatus]|uniref:YceD family protein n=1 Tax=Sphingoaurantiacus capsulatus TaxID=1771310 RepID=A0ABV7X7G0_9SPHN